MPRLKKWASPKDRFWAQVEKTDTCWLWIGARRNGYGALGIKVNGKWTHAYAHRFSYSLVKEIPVGMTLDHLCRNRICVNPEHLEPVSIWENVKRAIPGEIQDHMKKMSKMGHKARWGTL